MMLSRSLAFVFLGLSLAACGGSSEAAKSPDAETAAPAATEPAAAPSEPAAASGDGWEGESEAKSGAAASPEPAAPAGDPKVEETRTLEVIQKIVKEQRKPVRECYEKARKDLPTLQGDLIIHFVLDPAGKVKTIELNEQRSTLKAPPVVDCAIKVIKGLSFPPSSRGMETNVNYPYNFMP